MKKFLLGFGILLFAAASFSQPYGNEWIDYNDPSKRYAKFTISEPGIYRIDKAALEFALLSMSPSVDISNVDPRSIQVFSNGSEIPIYVHGETDGSFDVADYIELYCKGNDGQVDAQLFPSPEEQTNPYFSLITNSATYFITWLTDGSFSTEHYTTIEYGAAAVSPLPYYFKEQIHNFTNRYHNGQNLGGGVSTSLYEGGKGWISGDVGYNSGSSNKTASKKFTTLNKYNGANPPLVEVEVGVTGVNSGAPVAPAHHVRLRYGDGSTMNEFEDIFLDSYEYQRVTSQLGASIITDDELTIDAFASQNGAANSTSSDYSSLSFIRFRYPHAPDVANEAKDNYNFILAANTNEQHLNLLNWGSETTTAVYDPTLKRRYLTQQVGNALRCNLPAGTERTIYFEKDDDITYVASTEIDLAGSFGSFSNPLDLEVDSAFLIISHANLSSSASQYETYRNSTHNNRAVLVYIDDLYDQFAFGIQLHPSSISGFCDFAINNWSSPPQFLFLIGKSISESQHRFSGQYKAECLVPTIGSPPSDNLLTMGLGSHPYAPAMSTGRIAASSNKQVLDYLNKVRIAEHAQNDFAADYTIQSKQWQKRVLHFAGGDNNNQNKGFVSFLNQYDQSLSNGHFGGKRFLFSKTSGDVIEQLDLDTLRTLIRDGVSIMTFFGHGSNSGFDINVDSPSEWDNEGRYPVVLANSCYSGNIHLPITTVSSISEEFVLSGNLGAIAFVATPSLGVPNDLHSYSNLLYQKISIDNYGLSLGEQMRFTTEANSPMVNGSLQALKNISMGLAMTMHGDPSYRINPHSKSEMTINDPVLGSAVSISPSFITTDLDSFDVVVHVSNLGRSVTETFSVKASRETETGLGDEVKFQSTDFLGYEDTLVFRFPVDEQNGIGPNTISVEVDLPQDSIPEFDDQTNNAVLSIRFDVIDANISPVYPYDFGVVSNFDVTLRANTGYPFAPSTEYLIQIDTNDLYSSPWVQETTIAQSGAVIEWNPNLPSFNFPDSTVFFWRVTPKNDLSKWKEFSFQVIDGKFGWGQDHFFQFKNNDFDFLNYNRQTRQTTFTEASRDVFVNVVGSASSSTEYEATRYSLDGIYGEYGVAPNNPPSMAIVVIDTVDLRPWGTYGLENGQLINQDHQFGQINFYNPNSGNSRDKRVDYWFAFKTSDSTSRANMLNMIENEVPDGYYILAYSLTKAGFETHWNNEMFDAFEALGADSIRYVGNNHPYIFLTKKGDPSVAQETLGYDDRDVIQMYSKVYSSEKQGEIKSPILGPAMTWGSFHLKSRKLESVGDEVSASLLATNTDGEVTQEAVLTQSGQIDISQINADSVYDISLDYFTKDNANITPSQLRSWHVLFDPAPDAAVNPIAGTAMRSTKITAGESFHYGVAVQNISEFDFGNFIVQYWVTEKDGNIIQKDTLSYAALEAGAVIFDSVEISTAQLGGRYTLWMEVNPMGNSWHKEEYSFNNRAYRSLEIESDKNNPLLDVTFDGMHILNGDIVSPTPEIVMELKDENSYLLLDDTTTFDVFLTQPNGTSARVPFVKKGVEVMTFEPATTKSNKARVIYQPEQLDDGIYKLSVMGQDASGNRSGSENYSIEFEVINASMVTNVMNYPNPFTTSTRFVFTLTGSKIPDVFTIQILTVTGKVVREITKDELGGINIGRNVTPYAWNGTDEFGDRLANGVYLYRVIMKIDGTKIDHLSSGADQYITKEFGKMYLFR